MTTTAQDQSVRRGPRRPVRPDRAGERRPPRELDPETFTIRPRWRMRWIALLFVLIPVGCALAAVGVSTLLPPVYGAQADLILKPRIELSDAAAERVMLTEEAVLTSPRVLVPVATQGQRSLK